MSVFEFMVNDSLSDLPRKAVNELFETIQPHLAESSSSEEMDRRCKDLQRHQKFPKIGFYLCTLACLPLYSLCKKIDSLVHFSRRRYSPER